MGAELKPSAYMDAVITGRPGKYLASAKKAERDLFVILTVVQRREPQPNGSWLSAADELHDFVAIACGDVRLGPLRPRQNLQIALDGHTSASPDPIRAASPRPLRRVGGAIFSIHAI